MGGGAQKGGGGAQKGGGGSKGFLPLKWGGGGAIFLFCSPPPHN